MNESLPKKIITRTMGKGHADICHITRMRIPFFEVDMGQAVYHGNYYHLFELAREDMLRNTGFPYREFLNRQLHLTIVDSHCKYRKSLRYDDEIEIHTGISSLSRRNLSFSQLIYRVVESPSEPEINNPDLELCTESVLSMICVRFTGQPTLLPEDFRLAVRKLIEKP